MKVLTDRNLLNDEFQEQGYTYHNLLEKKGDWTIHKVEKNRKMYQAKTFQKKSVFINHVLKSMIDRELQIAEQVKRNFNYLVSYTEFFYTRTFIVIVYEHCPHGTIKDLLKNGTLDNKEIFLIMKDLFNGLEELKFLGIIHRNLAPECVYIDEKFHLRIAGYEFCEPQAHKTMIPPDFLYFLKMLKTPECTPPEVLMNHVCTFKAPVYSLGGLVFALFHRGKYHIECESTSEVITLVRNNDVNLQFSKKICETEKELKVIIIGMLRLNPKDRLSFVVIRDFVNRMFAEYKPHEDQIRSGLLSTTKGIIEHLQSSMANGQQSSMGEGELKKYQSLFHSPVPGPGAILKSLRNRGWNTESIEQTLRFAKNCRKSDIDEEREMKNLPMPNAFKSPLPLKSSIGTFASTMSLLSQTRNEFTMTNTRTFRINDFRRSLSKRRVTGQTTRDPWMLTKSRMFEQHHF